MSKQGKYSRYLEVLEKLGEPLGDWTKGETQITTNPKLMKKVEDKLGVPVGVIDEDQYLIHLRDAVLFPPKKGETEPRLGSYIRLVYTYQLSKNLGISILPINSDGKMVMNRAYRHAPRHWTIEAAGTIAKQGESHLATVKRCVRDELGCEVLKAVRLTTHFIPERGLLGGQVPIYAVYVDYKPNRFSDPTVAGHLLMTTQQYWKAVSSGKVRRKGVVYLCCDGYTNTAVKLAEMKGLIR
ncbi:MAG TPA: hypothetical protein PKD79_02115 [Candidatus Doudnabacteria bacterium]|nr:hypothetical protein [Candidatus Doudnabacteria bacterium]